MGAEVSKSGSRTCKIKLFSTKRIRRSNGTKRALLVGCNYPGTKVELAGCTNDVQSWQEMLTEAFGFRQENVKVLVDDNPDKELSTGKNIKKELHRIVTESKPGDVVFFHFSGYGVQVPADEDGDYEEDGLDEALCPTDMNLILDDDLREILSKLDRGVKFTMVSDCGHSSGMLDHKEAVISGRTMSFVRRIGKSSSKRLGSAELMEVLEPMKGNRDVKSRALDVKAAKQLLTSLSNKTSSHVEQQSKGQPSFRQTLVSRFGSDASQAAQTARTNDMSSEEGGQKRSVGHKQESDLGVGILIAGCQSHETSTEVKGQDGRWFGTLSYIIGKIVRLQREKYGKVSITNYDLVTKVRLQ